METHKKKEPKRLKRINEVQKAALLKPFGGNINQLAIACLEKGVAKSTVYDFIKGKLFPKVEQLEVICETAGLTLGQFFQL